MAISHSERSTFRMARAGVLRRRASSARRRPHTAWKNGIIAGAKQAVLDGDLDDFIAASLKQGV